MFKKLIGVVGALGLACAATAVAAAPPASAANLFSAHGTVYCENGGPVTGIWVYVNDGGKNGWASYKRIGKTAATYSYGVGLIPRGYWLAVGCGGTTSHWATTSYEEPTPALSAAFDYSVFCNNKGQHGACYAFSFDAHDEIEAE